MNDTQVPDQAGVVSLPVRRILDGVDEARTEQVADEVAVALLYNGTPFVVVMATPRDLADLALGFSLSEHLVDTRDQLQLIEITESAQGFSVHLKIGQTHWEALQQRQRGLNARTGCGLCGASALEQAIRPVRVLAADQRRVIIPARLTRAFVALEQQQPLNRACGAVHAAAVLHPGGLLVREDVGRHNALDKALGAAIAAGLPIEAVLLTSRASYEMVHKSAQCGVPVVAAISAPTALAVRLAQTAGIQLYGFVRDGRMTCYCTPTI